MRYARFFRLGLAERPGDLAEPTDDRMELELEKGNLPLRNKIPKRKITMCRNIRPLFNFDPPANEEEIHDAAVQFVRKISGSTRPSKRNQLAFEEAVTQVAATVHQLVNSLHTNRPPRNREEEAAKARLRSAARFA
jgi:hypothetical protein